MAEAPVYLYIERTKSSQQALLQRTEGGKILWELKLPSNQSKTSALLALDSLFVTLCESGGIPGTCEVLRLEALTGKLLSTTPGILWNATREYALMLNFPKWGTQALDSFSMSGQVFTAAGQSAVNGQVSLRQDCGQFDVLGARYISAALSLTLRDGCGLWTKTF